MSRSRNLRLVIFCLNVAAICTGLAGCFFPSTSDTKKSDAAPKSISPRQPHSPSGNPAAIRHQPPPDNVPPHNVPPRFVPANTAGVRQAAGAKPTTGQQNAGTVSVHLSAGAALPQPQPQGTVMTFSAEYHFTGAPKDGVQYMLVLQGRGGKSLRVVLRSLKTQGQLPAVFTPALRPGDGPFRGFIEEWPASSGTGRPGGGKRVSNVIPFS